MKKIFFIVWILAIATMFVACERDEEATLTTINVVDEELTPSYTSAEVQCRFDTKATLRNVYLQYASINTFAEYEEIEMQEESGLYKAQLTGLYDNTTYYIRYVASNRYSSIITKEISEFKTLQLSKATITTSFVTNITCTSATVGGNVTDDGGATVMERGVVYSTSQDPTTSNSKTVSGSGTGSFVISLTELSESTTYYVRAYAINSKGTVYGEQVNFSTLKRLLENGHEYVDLGLSVNWATCNVGANKPEDYGNYFAWGETEPKDNYGWSTYKWCDGIATSLTKYCHDGEFGTIDYRCILEPTDDAATVNWGGKWRMPTDEELTELCNNCTWTWTYQNDEKGWEVLGPNGKSIFLPATGNLQENWSSLSGLSGYYWSNSLRTDAYSAATNAYCLFFNAGNMGCINDGRNNGCSVRPVYSESFLELPIVTTTTISQITQTTAVVGGNVTSDGGANVIERGIFYSTNPNPTITTESKVISGRGTGTFICDLTNLQPSTIYYVRAYAVNSLGIAYGEQVSFTTKDNAFSEPTGTKNGHEYVDLGLSVKWADRNVGANRPEEYGDYFAWGETQPKDNYDWSTYKWCNGSGTTLTKYNGSSFGDVYNQTQLELGDDAAYANWGRNWRMPTDAELTELLENCTWTWTTQNGVNGYKVTSKKNGNSIFLPAAGYRSDDWCYTKGNGGRYWSCSRTASYLYDYKAYFLNCGSEHLLVNDIDRYYGQSVRPVCQ